MTKDEALDLALEALEEACEIVGAAWTWRNEKGRPAITAIKQARALDKKADNARELGLQAELEATNRQVEILSDALAESRREVAQLKAQPAVPDAFGTREGEHPQYIQGWNDCRAEMLGERKS